MGKLSEWNEKRKRGTRKLVGEDIYEGVSKVDQLLNPVTLTVEGIRSVRQMGRDMRRQKALEEKYARQRKDIQARQMQAALLEQAVLGDEVARRSRIAQRGGRRSLLSMGETGSGSLLI